jgi:hypothetical protein
MPPVQAAEFSAVCTDLNVLSLLACCRESGGGNPDHARMQCSQLWRLAMRRMRRDREVGVVERKLKHVSQVELGVVAQSGAGVCGSMLTFGDPRFTAIQTPRLLTGAICHAHENHPFVVFLGRKDQARTWFGLRVNVVRKVAPDDFSRRWFRPPTHFLT